MIEDILNTPINYQTVILAFIALVVVVIAAVAALIFLAIRQVEDLEIPSDADFFETLRLIPITVPIALDLLDLAFDVFAAPVSWFILDLLGLEALKTVTVVEGLIPGTQVLPTMTLAWVLARIIRQDRETTARSQLRDYQDRTRGQYPRLERSDRARAQLERRGRSRTAEDIRRRNRDYRQDLLESPRSQRALPPGGLSTERSGRASQQLDDFANDPFADDPLADDSVSDEGAIEGEFWDEDTDDWKRRNQLNDSEDDWYYDEGDFG